MRSSRSSYALIAALFTITFITPSCEEGSDDPVEASADASQGEGETRTSSGETSGGEGDVSVEDDASEGDVSVEDDASEGSEDVDEPAHAAMRNAALRLARPTTPAMTASPCWPGSV